MHEIIPGLYLGGIKDAEDHKGVTSVGIKAIVNCCTNGEFPDSLLVPDVDYYRVDVEDVSREPIHLFFLEASEFVDSYLERQEPVLIHCKSGISRSVTILISFLIYKRQFCLQEAFLHVMAKRKIICPNIGFMEQLCEFEEKVAGRNATVCMYKYTDWYAADASYRADIPDLDPSK